MRRASTVVLVAVAMVAGAPGVALAHDAPPGSEYEMADWMLLIWVVFFSFALVAFVIALKRGMLSHLEGIKYQILEIDEPDYYTPDWAREEEAHVPASRSPVGDQP